MFENDTDPTNGYVEYVSLEDASKGSDDEKLFKIVNNQVYLGVDNTTYILDADKTTKRRSTRVHSTKSWNGDVLFV